MGIAFQRFEPSLSARPASLPGTPVPSPARQRLVAIVAGSALAAATLSAAVSAAGAAPGSEASWAQASIAKVTKAGVLGSSAAGFDPQAPLTERALAAAIDAIDRLQNPPAPASAPPGPAATMPAATQSAPLLSTPSTPPPVKVLSTIPADAVIGGTERWEISVPSQTIARVAFAIDGVQRDVESRAPFTFARTRGRLVTTAIPDGVHQLAVAAHLAGGATYVAVWQVTVANTPQAELTPLPSSPTPVPITHAPPPAPVEAAPAAPSEPLAPAVPAAAPATTALYQARSPAAAVTIKQLDAALVDYLKLAPAAAEIQTALGGAGLKPPANTGTEVVARLLGLRFTQPASKENLELLPDQSATRAEAAYSFARLLGLDASTTGWVQSLAQSFTLPQLSTWQRRILTTAIGYVGYPYVWGGTSPTAEAPFGVEAPGGFDCSGFVWRVYKLTPYPAEGELAGVLRGRTTYAMSGEVPRRERIPAAKLQPGDVMFFGSGPHSKPSEVDHAGIYLGNGWLIDSSSEGVTISPFNGWYAQSFAWARRPLREAGLG